MLQNCMMKAVDVLMERTATLMTANPHWTWRHGHVSVLAQKMILHASRRNGTAR